MNRSPSQDDIPLTTEVTLRASLFCVEWKGRYGILRVFCRMPSRAGKNTSFWVTLQEGMKTSRNPWNLMGLWIGMCSKDFKLCEETGKCCEAQSHLPKSREADLKLSGGHIGTLTFDKSRKTHLRDKCSLRLCWTKSSWETEESHKPVTLWR